MEQEARVINIGSLNIDKTYFLEHFVRPKETIKAIKYEEFCGGKGLNQSIALSKAGAQVFHLGAVGEDGEKLVEMLQDASVNTDHLRKLSGVSGHAIIQIDPTGQNSIMIHGGTNQLITEEMITETLKQFSKGDVVLLQNETSNVAYAIQKAKEYGLKVAFNPSPMDDSIWQDHLELVDLFFVNEIEGAALAGIDSKAPERIIAQLQKKYQNSEFVLTFGEKGAWYFNQETVVYHESLPVKVVDTTGAGDTFSGYLLTELLSRRPETYQGEEQEKVYKECLKYASAAAAIAVSKEGAAGSIPSRCEVEQFIQNH